MSQTTGIVDVDLLRTLFDAGFREDAIDALQLLPIAKVSWASGSVTPEESKRAIKAIDWSHAIGNPKAIDLFTDWLDQQPGDEFWSYWEGYLEARALNEDPRLFRAEGFALLRCAERVAVASGGLFGYGTICAEERECLERIRLNYLLPSSSPAEQ